MYSWDAHCVVHIITCFCILMHTKLDYIAEVVVGSLDAYRLALAINLEWHIKEELRPTLPKLSGLTENHS